MYMHQTGASRLTIAFHDNNMNLAAMHQIIAKLVVLHGTDEAAVETDAIDYIRNTQDVLL